MGLNIDIGRVESVEDDSDGLRIKARVREDRQPLSDIDYAFPLLPKTFQTVPKVGEGVLILYERNGQIKSQRFYIGPIIPQPQFMEYSSFNWGRDTVATSLFQKSAKKPKVKISNFSATDGAFPRIEDIALVGRRSEDIILKDNEIDLRCGIRNEAVSNNGGDEGLFGDVILNTENPGYIQMKFHRNRAKGEQSIINLVGDRINLISHKNTEGIKCVHGTVDGETEPEHLIKDDELDAIINKLHPLPYGDKLVEILKNIRDAITNHVHPFPGMPPISTELLPMNTDYNAILSQDIRIS